jgi:prolipoprotein diacylglyceryltransferase
MMEYLRLGNFLNKEVYLAHSSRSASAWDTAGDGRVLGWCRLSLFS